MTRVLLCLTQQHDPQLVILALLVCAVGSAAAIQLFGRIRPASGPSRAGWIMLAAVGTGTMVWSTHFIAMMAYRTHAPVVLDPMLTLASLVLAIAVAAPGLALASRRGAGFGLIGGGMLGIAISAMHYLGMVAYRVDGIVTWDWRYVVASVVVSAVLGGAAFRALDRPGRGRRAKAAGGLALAVTGLHFTGMGAMTIEVMDRGEGLSHGTMAVLAVTTAIAGLLVVGCAAVSALIDSHTQAESYRRLRRMAMYDGLTGLPNRMSFNEELGLWLGSGLGSRLGLRGGPSGLAVVMVDLSRFKAVNDTYGHQAGDQLLIALAARLSAIVEPGECIARQGGDEFAALMSYDGEDDLSRFLERLLGVFATPFLFERFTATIGANIGVALAHQDGRDADTLLAKADLAMYRAKSAKSGEPCFYEAEMDDRVRDRRELTHDLREAIEAGAFDLHYQVQAALPSGNITGYEALIRWRHATRGAVSPALFIPLAEEIGQIIPLSIWVLRQACFEAATWAEPHVVSVNLSPLHLSDPRLIDTVRAALDDSGLPPERLTLELTESAIIHDRRLALAQLRGLKAMGIAIALDDFGVGYSSLDVLRSFPFDCIKLDASFVAEIEHDEQAVAILRSVASLGAMLNVPVLAEGIEQAAQLFIVAREGCSLIQGYLIGKPSAVLAQSDHVRQAMRAAPRAVSETAAA